MGSHPEPSELPEYLEQDDDKQQQQDQVEPVGQVPEPSYAASLAEADAAQAGVWVEAKGVVSSFGASCVSQLRRGDLKAGGGVDGDEGRGRAVVARGVVVGAAGSEGVGRIAGHASTLESGDGAFGLNFGEPLVGHELVRAMALRLDGGCLFQRLCRQPAEAAGLS